MYNFVMFTCIGYKLPTFWECWKVSVCPLGAGLRNVHFLIRQLVLDINCQHLGSICQLEGFCAPFGRRVRVISLARNLSGGKLSPRNLSKWVLFLGGSCPGGRCPTRNLSIWVLVQGELVRGDVVWSGTCPGGWCPPRIWSKRLHFQGDVVRGDVVQGDIVC